MGTDLLNLLCDGDRVQVSGFLTTVSMFTRGGGLKSSREQFCPLGLDPNQCVFVSFNI